jgi:hypothetical protein
MSVREIVEAILLLREREFSGGEIPQKTLWGGAKATLRGEDRINLVFAHFLDLRRNNRP